MDNRPDKDEVYDGEAAALAEMIQTEGWKVFVRRSQKSIEEMRDALEKESASERETQFLRGSILATRLAVRMPQFVIDHARKKR